MTPAHPQLLSHWLTCRDATCESLAVQEIWRRFHEQGTDYDPQAIRLAIVYRRAGIKPVVHDFR